jgi:hypothetical protein
MNTERKEKDQGQIYADQIVEECGRDAHCAMEELSDIAETEEEGVVIATFNDVLSNYDDSIRYCHEQAHHLAMFLYSYTGNLSRAMSFADVQCGGAVYHGLIESHFSRASFSKTDAESTDVTRICPQDPDNPLSLARYECLHGLGHGLMIYQDYDVFAAANNCEQLEPGLEQRSCFAGVFMENVERSYKLGEGIFDENDIFYPCSAVSSAQAPGCYNYHSSYLLKKNRFSYEQTSKDCDKITPEEYVKYCYRGLGRQLLTTGMRNPSAGISSCQVGDPDYHIYCFRGIVIGATDHAGTERGFQLCSLLPGEFRTDCYRWMGAWVLMISSDREVREKECSRAESPQYFEACMGARLEDLL